MTKKIAMLGFLACFFCVSKLHAQNSGSANKNELVCFVSELASVEKAEALARYFETVKEKITFYKIDIETQTLYLRHSDLISDTEALQFVSSQIKQEPILTDKVRFTNLARLENPEESGILYNTKK